MAFGATVRRLRLERHWTLAELGERTGAAMSAGAVSSVESGRSDNPTEETVRRFARAFGLSVPELRALSGLDTPNMGGGGEIAEILPRLRRLRPSRAQALALHELEAHGQDLRQEERERLLQMARAILEDEERREQEAAERSVAGQGAGGQNKHFEIEAARMTTGAG